MNAFVYRNTFRSVFLAVVFVLGLAAPGMASAQAVGDKATFTDLTTFEGATFKAEGLKGRPVLLYFCRTIAAAISA